MPESVLIVDDHPLTRDALAGLLVQHGFDVVGEASDGGEAIACAERLQPDLVLLDLSMPGMDGLEALPRIKKASPATSVIVFSGFSAERMEAVALAHGADRYVDKSADLTDLRGIVREFRSAA